MKRVISSIISALNLTLQKELLMFRLGLRDKQFQGRTSEIGEQFKPFLKPCMLVFDIGANRGDYTAAFLKAGTRVICIEPQKGCFKLLKARFKNNKNVQLLNVAADSEPGEKKIHISNMNTLSSMSDDWISAVKKSERFPLASWGKESVVKTTTLESLIHTYSIPDFIKIDVEGYELNVLKGLKQKVPLISIEYTGELPEKTIQCIEYLEGLGNIAVLINDTNGFYEKGNWKTPSETLNFLKNSTEKYAMGDLYIKFV